MAEKQNSQPDPDALGGPDGSTAGDAQAFDEQEQDAVESALAEAQASIREIQAAAEGAGGRDAAEGTLVSNAQASAAADAAMAAMMMGAGDDEDRPAVAAVAAVGAAARDVLLAAEADGASPAVAGGHVDLDLVDEHRGRARRTAPTPRPGAR